MHPIIFEYYPDQSFWPNTLSKMSFRIGLNIYSCSFRWNPQKVPKMGGTERGIRMRWGDAGIENLEGDG
jgi:hypothetical protein